MSVALACPNCIDSNDYFMLFCLSDPSMITNSQSIVARLSKSLRLSSRCAVFVFLFLFGQASIELVAIPTEEPKSLKLRSAQATAFPEQIPKFSVINHLKRDCSLFKKNLIAMASNLLARSSPFKNEKNTSRYPSLPQVAVALWTQRAIHISVDRRIAARFGRGDLGSVHKDATRSKGHRY